MKTKHTKGEWISAEYPGGDHGVYSPEGNSRDIALVRPHHPDEEVKANARLITAAPELLEFAIEMVRRYPNSPWIYKQGNEAIQKALEE